MCSHCFAACRKGSNRVAVTSDVFKFIRTHWRPANTQKPVVNTKRSSGGDKPGAGKEGDDVEMVAAASPGQPAGGEAEAVDVHSDAVADEDMNGPKGQENMPQNEAGQNAVEAMDVDDTVDGDKQAVDGDKPAAQEQALQGDEEDDDDDVIIAAPTEDGVTARVSGKVLFRYLYCTLIASEAHSALDYLIDLRLVADLLRPRVIVDDGSCVLT